VTHVDVAPDIIALLEADALRRGQSVEERANDIIRSALEDRRSRRRRADEVLDGVAAMTPENARGLDSTVLIRELRDR
jgi:vacuolar-type H+-ATPase subunit E/Vma4